MVGKPQDPAQDVGEVRAEHATVYVQLVEDEELQAPGRVDQAAVPGPGEDEFEHHVVGEEDVRRIGDDPRPVLR